MRAAPRDSHGHPTTLLSLRTQAAPLREQVDILTAIYCHWSYRHVHRAVVALSALMHTPPPPEPQLTQCNSPHEYAMAVSMWMLQWETESHEARFAREMPIPVEGGHSVSLRTYVRGLAERMKSAGKAGIFEDLDDDNDGIVAERALEKTQLVLEARACLTFALAHDVRWRRVIMRTPVHLFRERSPDNNTRMRCFVDACVAITDRFLRGELTLIGVAEAAAQAWLYD